MQLAYAAGIQPHVDAGDVLGHAELAHRHLPRPPAGLKPHMRIGEREAQVGQGAVIGRGRDQQIGVLPVPHKITRTGVGAAATRPLRLWHRPALRGRRIRCRQ
jgi:hypothetical protein